MGCGVWGEGIPDITGYLLDILDRFPTSQAPFQTSQAPAPFEVSGPGFTLAAGEAGEDLIWAMQGNAIKNTG